jgi:NTP pyrophosphatase (non-canonical NTP hydrolase)
MNTEQYQIMVESFDCHVEENKLFAHALGLAEEAGEFCGKLCKAHRKQDEAEHHDLLLELGDVIWRVAALCNQLGVGMDEVMALNIQKLTARKNRGTIIGEGDHR